MSAAKTPPRRKAGWQTRFLDKLKEVGNIRLACLAADIDRSTAYRTRQRDEDFAVAWADALQEGVDRLEEEAWKRAKSKSDLLMIFLLKAHRPELYHDKIRHEHTGKVEVEVATPTSDERRLEVARLLDDAS